MPVHGGQFGLREGPRNGMADNQVAPVVIRLVGKGSGQKVETGGFFAVIEDGVERLERKFGLGDRFDDSFPWLVGGSGVAQMIYGLGPAQVRLLAPAKPAHGAPGSRFFLKLVGQAHPLGLGDAGGVGDTGLLQKISDMAGVLAPDCLFTDPGGVAGLEAAAFTHAVDNDRTAVGDNRLCPVIDQDFGDGLISSVRCCPRLGPVVESTGRVGLHHASVVLVRSVNV